MLCILNEIWSWSIMDHTVSLSHMQPKQFPNSINLEFIMFIATHLVILTQIIQKVVPLHITVVTTYNNWKTVNFISTHTNFPFDIQAQSFPNLEMTHLHDVDCTAQYGPWLIDHEKPIFMLMVWRCWVNFMSWNNEYKFKGGKQNYGHSIKPASKS